MTWTCTSNNVVFEITKACLYTLLQIFRNISGKDIAAAIDPTILTELRDSYIFCSRSIVQPQTTGSFSASGTIRICGRSETGCWPLDHDKWEVVTKEERLTHDSIAFFSIVSSRWNDSPYMGTGKIFPTSKRRWRRS